MQPKKLIAFILSLILCPPGSHAQGIASGGINPSLIVQENLRVGSLDWQLTRVRPDAGGFRAPAIEGYCSKQSVAAGESIDIMVSTDPPTPFKLEFFRMGYYG